MPGDVDPRPPTAPSAAGPAIDAPQMPPGAVAGPRLRLREAPQASVPGSDRAGLLPLADVDALLLAWLAVVGPTPRERLAALLWPDSPSDAARTALRQRLSRLRRQFDGELVVGARTLMLADGVTHDLAGSPTLLGGLQLTERGTELDDWLSGERSRRREQQRAQLLERIDALEQAGETSAALPLAQSLLALDPLREDAHRRLMRLHYLAGDRATALAAFDECERRLKHELGARPSPETLELLGTIEAAERQAVPLPTSRRTLPAALMRPPRLVGRDAELARLRQVLADGGRALVIGDAGQGKSRLLQAVAGEPPSLLVAAGRPGDALVPYATLGRALRALLARLPRGLPTVPSEPLAALLPELAGQALPPPAPRREALLQAVGALVRQALATTGGIVLDDLHFADEATLQLLPELLAGSGPGAWLLATRPPAEGSAGAALLSALTGAAPWQTLSLAPLSDEALAELVDSLALPGVQGARLAPMLRARSGGNPLFALETLRTAWTEHVALDSGALPRPRTVGQLIEGSLAALSPPALLLARLAAIAGVDFSVELAEQLLRRSALELADAWAELEARQVLRGTAFAHDLVHEAVLAGIPEVLARHTHGQMAAWLESRAGEPARVAAHWEAAGQRERALPSLRAAAERAHSALREPERVQFLLRGADIAEATGRLDEAFDLVTLALEAHMNTIRDAAGVPLLERLDRLARTPRQAAVAANQRAWYCTNLGDPAGAIAAGELAMQRCAQVADAALAASIAQRLGTALAMAGRFDEALPHLRSAEPWFERHAQSDHAAEFVGNLATVLDNLGHPAEALPYHQRAIEATVALGDRSFIATVRANLAVSRLNAGDVSGARQQLALAQQLISGGDLKGSSAGFIAALQAQAERADGDYPAALAWCDAAEPLLAAASPVWLPVIRMHRAQALLDLGQFARAQQTLSAIAGEGLPARQRARHAGLWGRLHLALGQPARDELDAALACAPVAGWPELRLTLRIERAEVLDPAAAGRELQGVVDEATGLGLPGVVLAARLRLARRAAESAEALAAARAALAAMAADSAVRPNGLYRGECWLAPAEALCRAGQNDQARQVARDGWHWVNACAERLAPPLRDAFLHRQPVNQALQRIVSSLSH